MRTALKRLWAPIALVSLAAALAGCEDNGVTAPSDASIVVRANPSTVVIDPDVNVPDSSGRFNVQSSVEALIVSATGQPLSGVSVFFSTSAGTLQSGSSGQAEAVETNASGIARDVLTLNDADPDEATVSAVSAALEGSVTVTKVVVGGNTLPQAFVVFVPRNDENMDQIPDGPQGELLTFDGSSSSDPDSAITCYQWEILSDNPDPGFTSPSYFQGRSATGLNFTFQNVQNLGVNLRVSDKAETGSLCNAAGPPVPETLPGGDAAFSPFASLNQYQILCNNPPPTAVIAGPSTITLTGSPSTFTSVTLDGTLSFDNETPLDGYIWSCGNDQTPQPFGNGSIASCRYRIGTFTATLQVKDQGTGSIDPATGTWRCQKFSEVAPVQIIVNAP